MASQRRSGAPRCPQDIREGSWAVLSDVAPQVELLGRHSANLVALRISLLQHVQVPPHHFAVGLPPLQVHHRALLHPGATPDAPGVAHEGDGLPIDELPGEGGLAAHVRGRIHRVHAGDAHQVEPALPGPLRGHDVGLIVVGPVRGVQDDLHAVERKAPADLRHVHLVPHHQRHPPQLRLHHLRQLLPGGGPLQLAAVQVGLPVLDRDAGGAHEVRGVVEEAGLLLGVGEAKVDAHLLGQGGDHRQHLSPVLRRGLRGLLHLPPLEETELR
mmetsp:Transcript_35778/g.93674  ORF Transcript_35778/g.93674 Transcript_35778/m.93674 type:complete len:271 (-) Transcript_35778:332-1144(-)